MFYDTKLIIVAVNLFCRERGCLGWLWFAIFKVPRDKTSNLLRSFPTACLSSPPSMRSLLQNPQPWCSIPHTLGVQPFQLGLLKPCFFPPLTSLKAETLSLMTQCGSQPATNQPEPHKKAEAEPFPIRSSKPHANNILKNREKGEACSVHALTIELRMFGSWGWGTQRTYGRWRRCLWSQNSASTRNAQK